MQTSKYSVSYNGKYPSKCMGRLTIRQNGRIIYNRQYCCLSTGSVTFDGEGNEYITCGKLVWNDADKFDKEIQKAVAEKLSEIKVCCGGCV